MVDSAKANVRHESRWHLSLIPLFMAIGSPGLLATLVALSLGSSVVEIGVMSSAAALVSFFFSIVWGSLYDYSGGGKRLLIFFFIVLSPMFIALSMVNTVEQLIFLYTLLASVTCGVAPVAVMYTVECCTEKTWKNGVARYNSIASVGNIFGLVTYTIMAQFYPTRWLFYIAAAMCLASAFLLWILGEKHEATVARHPSFRSSIHEAKRHLSHRPHFHHMKKPRLPRSLSEVTPIHLLFLAAFVHWLGVNLFGVGQTPLMRALGLSDSQILAVNGTAGAVQAIAFLKVAPRVESHGKQLLSRVVAVRGGLILCWAVLPVFLLHPVSFVALFPLVITAVWSIFYTMIWLPITNFAVSHAGPEHKGSVQGELLSTTAIANAVGSALGGFMIGTYGYTAGFCVAAGIVVLAIPILSKISIVE